MISSESVSSELKVEAVVILGSLAKGSEHAVQCVFDSGVIPLLLKGTLALLTCNIKLAKMFHTILVQNCAKFFTLFQLSFFCGTVC